MSGAVDIIHMICGITFPSTYMDPCGVSALLEESLMNLSCDWFILSSNDKSSIILNCLDLLGMDDIDEILRFAGGLCYVIPFEYSTAAFCDYL